MCMSQAAFPAASALVLPPLWHKTRTEALNREKNKLSILLFFCYQTATCICSQTDSSRRRYLFYRRKTNLLLYSHHYRLYSSFIILLQSNLFRRTECVVPSANHIYYILPPFITEGHRRLQKTSNYRLRINNYFFVRTMQPSRSNTYKIRFNIIN